MRGRPVIALRFLIDRRSVSVPDGSAHRPYDPLPGHIGLVLLWCVLAGCAAPQSRFTIVDHREVGAPRTYAETFDEAFYDIDARQNLQLVLRREQPSASDPRTQIVQIISIRSLWRPIPGRTNAESAQINGTVAYAILSGERGATFEGAGSVFFQPPGGQGPLYGSLDRAMLRPTRSRGGDEGLFRHAVLSGSFAAVRDRRQVVRLTNELNRLFGPMPAEPERLSTR